MRTICRRSGVQNQFASFLNPDQERYELVCFGMYWYVPVSFSMNWYELVCTDIYLLVTVYSSMYKYTHSPVSMRQYVLVCTGMYWYVPVCFSMNWYELVCTDIHLQVTVYSGMYKYTHSPVSMKPYVLVCTGMYHYIPVHTRIYQHLLWFPIHQFRLSPLLDTWRYIKVHGSTWKYPKVMYTWIMKVQQGS
jgi:hypothetical protein